MSNPIKKLIHEVKKLIDPGPLEINRIELIIRKALEELETMKTDEVKNLKEIEMEILMKNGKLKIKKLLNDVDEYEMNN